MTTFFALLFLLTLLILPIGLIKPSMFNKLAKKEVTRKQAGIGLGTIIIVLLFLIGLTSPSTPADTKTENSTASKSKTGSTPTNKPAEEPSQHELDATIKFSEDAFLITNNEDLDWNGCRLEMNSGILRGGYKYSESQITANDSIIIPFREFTKDDGTRFDSYEIVAKNLAISCDNVGGKKGFGYFGISN